MEVGSQVIAEIPSGFYQAFGALIIANIGAIVAYFKSIIDEKVDRALIKQEMAYIRSDLNTIKKDLDAAHDKLRESNGP